VFKKGDLFFLNEEGKALFYHLNGENGIIISDGYILYEKGFGNVVSSIEYYGYDILIKGILFREVPEKFLIRVVKR
jgi:hypothetical protein